MANNSLDLTSLDFDTLKEQLKEYLSTQSIFKDYDFEGSNINVLLDVLSYNSYLNSFYLNMIASEMFLDTAQKWDTVVSHAKELNYTPRSAKSSVANVSITLLTDGMSSLITIPKGTLFSGTNSNGTYSFSTRSESTYTSPNNTFSVNNLQIYEGVYVNNAFIIDQSNETQKFVLTNENIDIDSLTVSVYEDNTDTAAEYIKVDTLFGLSRTSNVYFVQAAQNNQYEILFGDGFLGRKPKNKALIVAEYMVVNGKDTNGVTTFTMDTDLSGVNGGTISVSDITTVSNSTGGSNLESIESVRFYAPRYFATQQRAVATDDYKSLILSRFSGIIDDVNVYGGQSLEPKQYGRVAICLKPSTGTVAADYVKSQISNFLLEYISIPTRVIITNPEYIHCEINSTVTYDPNLTTKLSNDIKNVVLTNIQSFSEDNLEKFDKDFRYSKFIREIDDSDNSIISNETTIRLIKKLYPKTNTPTTHEILFDNELNYSSLNQESIIDSSYFTYVDSDGINYTLCKIKDDNNGTLIVYNYVNNIYNLLNSNIGTVDYTTGEIVINSLNVANYNSSLYIYAKPKNKDIIVSNDKILVIDAVDVTIETEEEIS